MEIKECKSYHAVLSGITQAKMPDRKSSFKIYFISVIGRSNPELYEWDHCALTREEYYNRFLSGGHVGIGFVTAFPHITKVFRFSPARETVLDVKVFDSPTFNPIICPHDNDNFSEFSCYAEAVIASEEYHAWARSVSIEEYLKQSCKITDFPVKSNRKMMEYWAKTP